MTEQHSEQTPLVEPEQHPAPTAAEQKWIAARDRDHEIQRILNSESARSVMRFLRDDGNGIEWREFLREIGGALHLADYLDSDGQPDGDKIRPVIDTIFYRTATKEFAGGMTMRRHPINRKK